MTTAVSVARHLGIVNDTAATIRGAPIPANLKLSVSSDGNREQVQALCDCQNSICSSVLFLNCEVSLNILLMYRPTLLTIAEMHALYTMF